MYGMIHRAARAFAIKQRGEPFWARFSDERGLTEAAFITAENYPDEMTLDLLASLSEASGIARPALLEAFGTYWIEYARHGPYANIMAMGGGNLPDFIANLNRMHEGLALAMPGSRMPTFHLLEETPDGLRLNYVSERPGLETFVVGLLKGLCDMFSVDAEVCHVPGKQGEGVGFEIRYLTTAEA